MQVTRSPESPWYSDPEKKAGWDTSSWATPFSRFRHALAAVCNYTGKAIYMDSDMLVMRPIDELWNIELAAGKAVAAKNARRLCVMLIDCQKMRGIAPTLAQLQRGARPAYDSLIQEFTPEQSWNCLDGETLPIEKICNIHFTSVDSQPNAPMAIARLKASGEAHWFDGQVKPHWRPELTALWHREYNAALAAGYKVADYIPDEVFGPVPKRSLQNYRGLNAR